VVGNLNSMRQFLNCPIGQWDHVPLTGVRVRVGYRPGLIGKVELAPLGQSELAAALQGEQEHSEDMGEPLKSAGLV
jgi:hypothetical protein